MRETTISEFRANLAKELEELPVAVFKDGVLVAVILSPANCRQLSDNLPEQA